MGTYMKYGEIQGDATEEGFKGWINISEFTWAGVDRNITTKTGRARNREQAQPLIHQITVKKEVDHASGPLYKSLCAVPKAETCRIAFVRTGDAGGDNDKYLEYVLTDALLASLSLTGEDNRGSETWIIDFTEIMIEVKQLSVANVAGAPFKFRYNMATGKHGPA
jgi:type VI secretion system secreted protein Hcp